MELLSYIAQSWPLSLLCVGIVGLLLGSFLNVVALRWPEQLMWQWKQEALAGLELPPSEEPAPLRWAVDGSRCPHCQHRLAWWENLPLIGFALLRGRCRSCKTRISWRYPLVELITALLGIGTLLAVGTGLQGWLMAGAIWGLLTLSLIDLKTYLLPDPLVYCLLWAGLLASAVGLPGLPPLISAVEGAAVGYLLLWTVYWLFKLIRGKEGMGYGDFKLLAALGAWCGLKAILPIVVVSCLLGALIGGGALLIQKRNQATPIPFGPFLAIAGALELWFPGWLWHVAGLH